jgi:two-component system, chemotaxis family, chemotaxis protein CheY
MKTILIVDDDPVSVRLIAMIVARNGYATAAAGSAAEALAWLESAEGCEIVITDQNLGGMTGLELYSALHADVRYRNIPVILCTGVADRATITEAMALGIRHVIIKPITPKVVMDKVVTVEAERPRVIEGKVSAMSRLDLSEPEFKALVHASQQHLARLKNELAEARKSGDHVTTIMVAGRLREPASLLDATRLLAAIDTLEATRTWHDLEDAVALVFDEIGAVESALEVEAKPQLLGRPMGYPGPDR